MAGIGIRLNKIYGKNTLTTHIIGASYSTLFTIAPMLVVIGAIIVMQSLLKFSAVGFADRELFSATVLYIFIFALLTTAPFNSVLSRYLSDVIYDETYEDIPPCYYIGMMMNVILSAGVGIPFCLREYFVGKVDAVYVVTGYSGYMALVLVFYSMLYLSICKDYIRMSAFFTMGMVCTVLLSLLFCWRLHWSVTYSMLCALAVGLWMIAVLSLSLLRSYFRENSGNYSKVLRYFRMYWQLIVTNFIYTLGLYIHNFVFWTTDLRIVVANSFICATTYDMATCLAMFTNISATVIFVSRVEMHFHERYKAYSEAVIGGRGCDIEIAKKRMFRMLAEELVGLVRIQFIITVVIYLFCMVLLPKFGFGGMILRIYPCLAVGYFILFVLYAEIIFLYYFNDLTGSVLTAVMFMITTLAGSILATHLSEIWYGIGLVLGSAVGWAVAYFRLRYMEKTLDVHTFCKGELLKKKKEHRPSSKVYDRYAEERKG